MDAARRARRSRPSTAHGSDVWELVFDASGEKLFTGSSDGTARVWNVADSRLLAEPFRRGRPVTRRSTW